MQWRRKQRVLYVIGSAHHALLIKQYRDDGECLFSPNDDEGDGERTPLETRPTNPQRGGKPRQPYARHRGSNDYKQPALTTEKKTFNEEEYTKITTPRQDVLFKKGYLGRKKSTLANTVPEANVSPSADAPTYKAGGAADGDRTDMPTEDSPQYVYTNGYVDQGGVYYINGGSYELYDPFTGNVTVVVGPAPHYAGAGGGPPVLAAVSCQPLPLQPLEWFNPTYLPYSTISCPRDRRKRSSTDSQNCSPQSSESTEPPEPLEDCAVYQPQAYVYPGYMFGPPVYNMNGITVQGAPPQAQSIDISSSKRRKKKRRRRRRRGGVDDGFEGSSSDDKELEEPISFTSQDSSQDLESDSKHSAESTSCPAENSNEGVQKETLKSIVNVSKENTSSAETNNDSLEIGVGSPENMGFENGIDNNHISNMFEVRPSIREHVVLLPSSSDVSSKTEVDSQSSANMERDRREERGAGDLFERSRTNVQDGICIVSENRSNVQPSSSLCINETVNKFPSLVPNTTENTVVLCNTQHKESVIQGVNTKERNKSKRQLKLNKRTHAHMNGCHEQQFEGHSSKQNTSGGETPGVFRTVSDNHNCERQQLLDSESKIKLENQCNAYSEERSFSQNPTDESSEVVAEQSSKIILTTEPLATEEEHKSRNRDSQIERMDEVENSDVLKSSLPSIISLDGRVSILPTVLEFTHLTSAENCEKLSANELCNVKSSQSNTALQLHLTKNDMQEMCSLDASEHEINEIGLNTARIPKRDGTSHREESDVQNLISDTDRQNSVVLSSVQVLCEGALYNSLETTNSDVDNEGGKNYGVNEDIVANNLQSCSSGFECTNLQIQDLNKNLPSKNQNEKANSPPPVPPPRRKKWHQSRKAIGRVPLSRGSNEKQVDDSSISSTSTSHESKESVIELLSITPGIHCNAMDTTKQLSLEDEGVVIVTQEALYTKPSYPKLDSGITEKWKMEPVNEVNISKENASSASGRALLGKETFLSENKEHYSDNEHRFISNANFSLRGGGEQMCISSHSKADVTRDQSQYENTQEHSFTHSLKNELGELQDVGIPLFIAERFADVIARKVMNEALSISVAINQSCNPPFLPITEAVTKWLHSQLTKDVLSVPESGDSETDSTEEMEGKDNKEPIEKGGNTTGSKNVLRNPLPASSRKTKISMIDTGIRVASLDKKYMSFSNNSHSINENLIRCCSKLHDVNNNRFLIPGNENLKTRKDYIHESCQYRSVNVCNSICSTTYCSDSTFNNDSNKGINENGHIDDREKDEKCDQISESCTNRFDNDTRTNTPDNIDSIITEEYMEYDAEWESDLITLKSTPCLTSIISNEESECSLNAESPSSRCFHMCDPSLSVSKYYRLGPPTEKIDIYSQDISSHTESESEEELVTLKHFKDELSVRDHYSLCDELYICENPIPEGWSVDHIKIAQDTGAMHNTNHDDMKSVNCDIQSNESVYNQNRKTCSNSTNQSTEKADIFSRKSAILMSHFTNDGPFPCGGICCILQ